jgi:hypothetical protein
MSEISRITPPSTVILNERPYPVITNDPSFSDICEYCAVRMLEMFLLLGAGMCCARGCLRVPQS